MSKEIARLITLDDKSELSIWDNEQKSKQPVIFIHGLTGNGYQLQHYKDHLNDDFRIITVDLRGRGDSGNPASLSNIDEHCNDIIQLIKKLELKRVVIVGYSMGAFIAAKVATMIDLDSIILLDGCATMSDRQNDIVTPSFARLSNVYPSKENYVTTVIGNYQNMGVKESSTLYQAVSYEVKEDGDKWISKSNADAIVSDWNSFYDYDVDNITKNINCPVLLIEARGSIGNSGPLFEKDDYITTENNIKNLEVVVTKENHYTLVFNHQDLLNNKIEEFLK